MIELIMTVAIFSIVSVALMQFMVASSSSFATVDAAVTLQQKSQLAMNNMKDTAMETSDAVWVDGDILYLFSRDMNGTDHIVHCYEWDGSDKIIYKRFASTYYSVPVTSGAVTTTPRVVMGSQIGEEERLIDGVSACSFVVTTDSSDVVQNLEISISVRERSQGLSTQAQVTFRNHIRAIDRVEGSDYIFTNESTTF